MLSMKALVMGISTKENRVYEYKKKKKTSGDLQESIFFLLLFNKLK